MKDTAGPFSPSDIDAGAPAASDAATRAAALSTVTPDPQRQGPLRGIRVVDLSRLVAGNMLTLQLADFGADVIKVEAAGSGDTLRQWREAHPDLPGGFDAWWQVYSRNKRSLAMNLRDADAMAWLRRLLDSAQVLVESFRPGTLEKMGLAPATLHQTSPGLVVVRVSGWGQSGPYRSLPGFGSLIEGFSGYAFKHRQADQVPQLPNLALADMIAGLTGAFATLAAVREVEVNGGRGQVLDLSLLEPMLAILGPDVAAWAATGELAEPGRKISSPRGAYRCRDGRWVAMSGSTDTMARKVFEAIGQGALYDDPRFSTNAARLANDGLIETLVAGFVASHDQAECLALFRAKGVTVGPIYDPSQLVDDEHVVGRDAYLRLPARDGVPQVVMHNIAPRLEVTPGGLRRAAPGLGQHSRDLLDELGADAATIDGLAARGAIDTGC